MPRTMPYKINNVRGAREFAAAYGLRGMIDERRFASVTVLL